MSRLSVPIQGRVLYATGDLLLRAELDLLLKTNAGGWVQERFLVDSGAETTTFPAWLARCLDLPLPTRAASGAAHAQTGAEIRSGYLRFQILGMDQTEYALGCLFLGDPATPPGGPPGSLPRKLLQPLGLINKVRVAFDDAQSSGAPYGEMTVEKK
jgi:hypothetical protein